MSTIVLGKSFPPRLGRLAAAAAVQLLILAAIPAQAAPAGQDESIVASLNLPPEGLNCADAAAQTSVYFNFARPEFQITKLSLFLDGQGVPQEAVDEHWPTITLTRGLHSGRNTVDVVADGAGGRTMTRRLVVQVGPASGNEQDSPATVACDENAVAQGDPVDEDSANADDQPPEIVDGSPRPIIEENPPDVVYYDRPVYIYRPYPVIAFDPFVPFIPVFGFGFFYSHYHPYYRPPVIVNRPYWHDHGRYDHWHNDHDRDDRRGGGDQRHDGDHRNPGHDGRPNGQPVGNPRFGGNLTRRVDANPGGRFDGTRGGVRRGPEPRQTLPAQPQRGSPNVYRTQNSVQPQHYPAGRPQQQAQVSSQAPRGNPGVSRGGEQRGGGQRGGGNDRGGDRGGHQDRR